MKSAPRAKIQQSRPRGKAGTQSKSVRIDLSQHEKLAAINAEVGIPIDQMVREALDEYLGGYLAALLAFHRSKRGNPAHPAK